MLPGVKISVIGCGYLGAVHASCMADFGHDVVGLDIDERKVAKLAAGVPSFHEPGLEPLLRQGVADGSLRFTTDKTALADARVHFIAVGTPQRGGSYAADMSYVWTAVEDIIANASPSPDGPIVVVGKSTVPVGTAQAVADRLAEAGVDAVVVWNPEFLREGYAVQDTQRPDRVVYGLPDDRDRGEIGRAVLDEVYAPIIAAGIPRLLVNYPTAELVKVAANSFLATKISFINSMAELCDASGADVTRLAEAIGHDERIGSKFLQAGIGFGGGCLPKDIRAFMARAGELGASEALTFLREVDNVNMRRRTRMVEVARNACGGSLLGTNIAILGAAFKPESDDVRDSPALNVAGQLQLQGAAVNVYDPKALDNANRLFPTLTYAVSVEEACERADAVLVLTEWREFVDLNPDDLADQVRARIIVDGRNCLDVSRWEGAGWRVF